MERMQGTEFGDQIQVIISPKRCLFFCWQIVNPPKDLKKPRGKKCFFVKFFGTEDQ